MQREKAHHPVKIGPVSLSRRERQVYMEIREAQRRGEIPTAKHITRMMCVHHGPITSSQVIDILGKLWQRKKVIWLDRETKLPYNPAVWRVFRASEDRS